MINLIFLVIIFLFMAIEAVCAYKFFRVKDIKLGIFSTIYFLLTLILTLNYFFNRDVTKFNELDSVINGISNFNIIAILVLLLNIGMIVISILSVIKLGKTKSVKK